MNRSRMLLSFLAVAVILAFSMVPASSQTELPPPLQAKIDSLAASVLAKTGVPSASVAVVRNGSIAYVKAYGSARLDPDVPASSAMPYCIGSISKQFTAAAILLLQEAGKLSLEDKVARYIPDLTRADEVTIRELLSHTSGYQDYWPEDYVMPPMLQPVTAGKILDQWARKPLDFDPGTQWQYSNTNYVIAGMIVEKVSGTPLLEFLQKKIFAPLGMTSATDMYAQKLSTSGPAGYLRYALGPPRPAPVEGQGWMFAAGELAMSAQDLARWDISMIDKTVLTPASYRQLGTEVLLANGTSTSYGLGVSVGAIDGHRTLSHGGEVSGYTAQNIVFPDDRAAVAVLTNQDAARAASSIGRGIAALLVGTDDPEAPAKTEQARRIFEGLQQGTIDRSLFTEYANSYFSEQALKDCQSSLGPLGTPTEFRQTSKGLRGGMTSRSYQIKFGQKSLRAWTFEMPDGKLEQYQIAEQE